MSTKLTDSHQGLVLLKNEKVLKMCRVKMDAIAARANKMVGTGIINVKMR